ncbi:hypothetical protein [Pseudophaeobacter flagellatus]|uniref:hypothetical protein n=1 Tax=Pseudophaeobacter flagellatus TaxID=2899119 RepID=UPI001E3F5583|nr:hypothetical protein [Pseudophaeobacter flagellatus]MCD9148144.1 hypothetical protein [Pseudophaeobacter flagellatus]
MDYSKKGGPRMGRNSPRHAEHNAKGSQKNPYDKRDDKSALLGRMKVAAEKAKES